MPRLIGDPSSGRSEHREDGRRHPEIYRVANVDEQGNRLPTDEDAWKYLELLPFLRELPTARTWAGLMPFSLDGKPLIGRIPGREGLFIVSGLASSGFAFRNPQERGLNRRERCRDCRRRRPGPRDVR